ncbi:MAG: hypothetical protein HY001_00750 [Candidatus Portnoybacteria bacterium]|nr:hypothetical protein [Candidatus Portnoybacteria bacterium]
MTQEDLEQKIKEAQQIYEQAMAKLQELEVAHEEILASARKRVEGEQMNSVRQSI